MILIPGLTAGRDIWRGTAAAVPGYRYHLVQVAGFARRAGARQWRGRDRRPARRRDRPLHRGRGLRRPAIVGHSMGGTLAMMVAARRPELVGRIMVVDMLPQPAGLFGESAAGIGPLADSLGNFTDTPGGRRLFGALMNAFSPPNSANRAAIPTWSAAPCASWPRSTSPPELARIRAPLTVVYASPDRRRRARRSTAASPAPTPTRADARLVRIDGSGHMVMLDQPARFRAEVARLSRALGRQHRIHRLGQRLRIIERVVQPAALLAVEGGADDQLGALRAGCGARPGRGSPGNGRNNPRPPRSAA